ncbi:MAG TPA: lasso peptide biosynthesis B2 protein [Pyrinomonadaceae bacterium]|nr:lasso peptide biosynthesis B2 protein [Pyrinomonadaceae bacterium]
MRKAVGFVARKPREAWLVVRLAAWVAALSALVKFLPLPKVLSLVSAAPRKGGRADGFSDKRVAQLLDALLATDVLCFTPTCWKRAPVLHRYLALGGRQTRVVFGLRKGGGGLLDGHAWLEDHGRPLFEATWPDYTVTYSFPSPQPDSQVRSRV